MKTSMKKLILLTLLIASAVACRDEDVIRVPEFQRAPNYRMVIDPVQSFFNLSALNTTKIVYDLFSENYNDFTTIEVIARYQKAGNPPCDQFGCLGPVIIKTYTGAQLAASQGVLRGEEMTAQQVLAAFGLTASDVGGGDQFLFTNKVTMTDGRVYPSTVPGGGTNVPTIFGQAGASYTATFNVAIGCPYVVSELVGMYDVVVDAFGASFVDEVEVVSGPGANQFTVKNILGNNQDFVCTVNPANGAVSSTRQQTWSPVAVGYPASYGAGFIQATATNGSSVYTCAGQVNLKLTYSVDIGTFANIWDYKLLKQ